MMGTKWRFFRPFPGVNNSRLSKPPRTPSVFFYKTFYKNTLFILILAVKLFFITPMSFHEYSSYEN
jgi:hypothetical protein